MTDKQIKTAEDLKRLITRNPSRVVIELLIDNAFAIGISAGLDTAAKILKGNDDENI